MELKRLRLPLPRYGIDLLLVGDQFEEGGRYVQLEVSRAASESWTWSDWDDTYGKLAERWRREYPESTAQHGGKITDLDAWRRVCLKAFDNLTTDTAVTMGQVDAVLLAGAKRGAGLVSSDTPGLRTAYRQLLADVAAATGVAADDVDAILTWTASDAAPLIAA